MSTGDLITIGIIAIVIIASTIILIRNKKNNNKCSGCPGCCSDPTSCKK